MLAGSILELGTAYGYSALCMARAQPETGRIWTIDPDRRRTAIARSFFERAGVAERIEIIEQPALEVLPKMAQRQYDIVFIDALKEEYADYLRLALPHVKRSGLVIVLAIFVAGVVLFGGYRLFQRVTAPYAGDGVSNAQMDSSNKIEFDYMRSSTCHNLTFDYRFLDSKGAMVDEFRSQQGHEVAGGRSIHVTADTARSIDSRAVRFEALATCHD